MKTMVKVLWIKSHPEFSYFAGETGEITPENAEKLSPGGFIQVLPSDGEEDDNPLPAELPARELLHDNGYTLDKLEGITAATLQEIDGIGPKTSADIVAFLNPTA